MVTTLIHHGGAAVNGVGLPRQLHPITPLNKPDQALFFTSSGRTQLTAALGPLH